ncbi:hypothetical protein VPH35_128910 [Triticum aestivum]
MSINIVSYASRMCVVLGVISIRACSVNSLPKRIGGDWQRLVCILIYKRFKSISNPFNPLGLARNRTRPNVFVSVSVAFRVPLSVMSWRDWLWSLFFISFFLGVSVG